MFNYKWHIAAPVAVLAAAVAAPRLVGDKPAAPMVFNVQDYGATPNNQDDDTQAIQDCIDAAIKASRKPTNGQVADRVVVELGTGNWYTTSWPLYVDADTVTISGKQSWIYHSGRAAAITLGVYRNDGGRVVDSSYRPGGASISTSGTYGPAFVKYVAGPLDLGRFADGEPDHYATMDKLTLDFIISGTLKKNQYLMGNGKPGGLESPWAVWVPSDNANLLTFAFKTEGQSRQNDAPFKLQIDTSKFDLTKATRFAFQVDLSTRTYAGFVNGVAVPLLNGGETRTPGAHFLCNEGLTPFGLGAVSTGEFDDPSTVPPVVFYGLSLASELKYKAVPVGGQQLRVTDGKPADPAYCVSPWGGGPGLMDALRTDPVPGNPIGVRFMNGYGYFRFMNSRLYASNLRVEGVNLRTNGIGILVGNTNTTTVTDVAAEGVRGISGFTGLSSYVIYLDKCKVSGSDTPCFLSMMDVDIRNMEVLSGGIDSFRCVDASVSIDGMRVWFPGHDPKRILASFGGSYGGKFSVYRLGVDYEGNGVRDCGIRIEQTAYAPGKVILNDLSFGTVGRVPLVRLVQWGKTLAETDVFWRCTFRATDVDAYGGADDYTGLVEVEGPAWHGTADSRYLSRGLINSCKFGTCDVAVTVGK